jgi:alpha-N-acetylglucosamine transferase
MKGDKYVPGALVLAYSIKQFTKYDVACMITSDVSDKGREQLKSIFDHIFVIDYLKPKSNLTKSYLEKSKNRWKRFAEFYQWLDIALTKFNLFKFTQYKKVLFLDADQLVRKNTDFVFDYQTPAGLLSINTSVGDDQLIPEDDVIKSLKQYGMRGNIILLKPSMEAYSNIQKFVNNEKVINYIMKKDFNAGPDEALITLFFRKNWHKLPDTIANQKYDINQKYYIHHYMVQKPWTGADMKYEDVKIWWQVAKELMNKYPKLKPIFTLS